MYFTSQYELQARPNGRACADEYYHQGNTFIEGREGSKYTIWFKNNTNQRVMAIVSVDGLDVCKGQPAGPDSNGYLVNPGSSIEIPGWKLDDQTAAEFYFAKIGKSYAHASGANSNNVGVIGAMVFREKQYYHSPYMLTARGIASGGIASGTTTSVFGSAALCSINNVQSVNMVSQSVGTGFGDATQFATSVVNFEKANPTIPDAVMVIYYNSARNLQKMGIQLKSKSTRYDNTSTAQAFPGYSTGCTPPPGWNK